jgi:hypothetical protein
VCAIGPLKRGNAHPNSIYFADAGQLIDGLTQRRARRFTGKRRSPRRGDDGHDEAKSSAAIQGRRRARSGICVRGWWIAILKNKIIHSRAYLVGCVDITQFRSHAELARLFDSLEYFHDVEKFPGCFNMASEAEVLIELELALKSVDVLPLDLALETEWLFGVKTYVVTAEWVKARLVEHQSRLLTRLRLEYFNLIEIREARRNKRLTPAKQRRFDVVVDLLGGCKICRLIDGNHSDVCQALKRRRQ